MEQDRKLRNLTADTERPRSTIGFIGAGNMAGAILKRIVLDGVWPRDAVYVHDIDDNRLRQLNEQYGVHAMNEASELIKASDVIVLCVKPNIVEGVLRENRRHFSGKAVVSIAAAWSVDKLRALLPEDARCLRVMPNTPALLGEGMTALSRAHTLTQDEARMMEKTFASVGRVLWVEESQMEAVTAVSGSGPAYAYQFIEAMADGGVALGLNRAEALEMAAQTFIGSARMVLETGMHPGELKDMVCSPGGTTIEALRSLEENGLTPALIKALLACADKAKRLRG